MCYLQRNSLLSVYELSMKKWFVFVGSYPAFVFCIASSVVEYFNLLFEIRCPSVYPLQFFNCLLFNCLIVNYLFFMCLLFTYSFFNCFVFPSCACIETNVKKWGNALRTKTKNWRQITADSFADASPKATRSF